MKQPSFYASIIVSVGIHGVLVWVFYAKPLYFENTQHNFYGKLTQEVVIPHDEDVDLSEKNIALEEVFNQIIVLSPSVQHPYDYVHTVATATPGAPTAEPVMDAPDLSQEISFSAQQEGEALSFIAALSLPSDLVEEAVLAKHRASPLTSEITHLETDPLEYIRELQQLHQETNGTSDGMTSLKLHYLPVAEQEGVRAQEGKEMSSPQLTPKLSGEFIALTPPEKLQESVPDFNQQPVLSQFLATSSLDAARELIKHGELPHLAAYGLPQGTVEFEWSNEFDIAVKVAQKQEGGYLFSVTFTPKYDLSARKMGQTTYFLIDRSNSVNRQKYASFKKGVARSLEFLQEGDKFNIVVFDQKISKLSATPLVVSKKTVQDAEDFLAKQEHGSYFAATDIYSSLPKIIPAAATEDEITSVILLSDGDSSQSPQKQLKAIRPWLEKNSGKIHLYTATIGSGNNLTFLDLLSSFGRGSLLHSDTNSAFPRKLASLILHHRTPIAKDIVAAVITSDSYSHIKLLPPSARLPCLFSKTPYTIYGMCDTPSEFMISLQGRSKNKTFSITKTISFAKAKQNDPSLIKEFNEQQAHLYYDDFIQDGKTSTLEKAKMILQHVSPRHRR